MPFCLLVFQGSSLFHFRQAISEASFSIWQTVLGKRFQPLSMSFRFSVFVSPVNSLYLRRVFLVDKGSVFYKYKIPKAIKGGQAGYDYISAVPFRRDPEQEECQEFLILICDRYQSIF